MSKEFSTVRTIRITKLGCCFFESNSLGAEPSSPATSVFVSRIYKQRTPRIRLLSFKHCPKSWRFSRFWVLVLRHPTVCGEGSLRSTCHCCVGFVARRQEKGEHWRISRCPEYFCYLPKIESNSKAQRKLPRTQRFNPNGCSHDLCPLHRL